MSEFDGSYDHDFIVNNPIPARCKKCKRQFVDGEVVKFADYEGKVRQKVCNEAIRAPTLSNCRCFYCWGELVPLDKKAYAERLTTLHLYRQAEQGALFETRRVG